MKKIFILTVTIVITALVSMAFMYPAQKIMLAEKANKAVEPGKWTVDKAHSNVKFNVTHLVVSEVEGSFKLFDGSMENTKSDLSDAKINFTVDVNSINTDNEKRDGHLKSDDFFNAGRFPSMKFTSTSMKSAGDNKYKLAGDLTIRDVTKPVVFDVTYGGSVAAMGTTKLGFKAKTTINRFDYSLKWDKATESGGLVVSKDVDIIVNAELNKVKE
ncbi:MAG TPA: YceI family protein [Flavitalea sp.]|nr:YceI family protein [Flavitalea sp.]